MQSLERKLSENFLNERNLLCEGGFMSGGKCGMVCVRAMLRHWVQRERGRELQKFQATPAKARQDWETMREIKRMKTNWVLGVFASTAVFADGLLAQEETVFPCDGRSKLRGGAR
jgi:hypothetical protein